MANYLLLRNNKQQGPLSLQHLIQLGLKPYDLVWVEGKSAAWRYPSEIAELKPYAAVVEEQPFDRFYKKPDEQRKVEIVFPEERQQHKPAFVMPVEEKKEAPVISFAAGRSINDSYESRFMPKTINDEAENHYMPKTVNDNSGSGNLPKTINDAVVRKDSPKESFVTFGEINFPNEVKDKIEEKPIEVVRTKSVYVTMPLQTASTKRMADEPVFKVQPSPVFHTREEPLETKYSQPLDEIKEMYAQKLNDRKKQSAQKKLFIGLAKKTAVVVLLAGGGVLIGFGIKPSGKAKEQIASTNYVVQNPSDETEEESTVQQNENIPVVQKELAPPDETPEEVKRESIKMDEPAEEKTMVVKKQTQPENEIIVERKPEPANTNTGKAVMGKQKTSAEKQEPVFEAAPSVEANPSTGERTKKTRENGVVLNEKTENTQPNDEEDNNQAAESLSSFVSVKSNEYHVVAFGGIRNLQLTVSNESKYVLDNVQVEVKYLKPTNQSVKTETVEFKSVAPNGTLTIRVPDTNRGMKVVYKIIKVESKEYKNDLAGL